MSALDANTTGFNNNALGKDALGANTTGNYNNAVGEAALLSNTTGESNIAIGGSALRANTTANYNTAVGESALRANTTGANSVAVGKGALDANTTGDQNVGVGLNAGGSITTGSGNTIVGGSAGAVYPTTGIYNTILGYNANAGATGASGQIVIGTSLTGTADNRVHIGGGSGKIYNDFNSNATWTQTSDERKKKNIVSDNLGLEFINDLRTVKYKFKAPSEFPKEWESYNEEITEPCDNRVHHGLLAQEVKQALDNAGVDSFEGWDILPDGSQQISREMFVIPLIKAVQELSVKVDSLQNEINTLKGE